MNLNAISPVDLTALGASSNDTVPGRAPADAAREFESVFVSMLLKQMRQSLSEEGLFPGDQSDTFGSLFDLYMGQHVAQSGGIGLADSLAKSLEMAAKASAPDAVE